MTDEYKGMMVEVDDEINVVEIEDHPDVDDDFFQFEENQEEENGGLVVAGDIKASQARHGKHLSQGILIPDYTANEEGQ